MSQIRVLVVEDSLFFRDILVRNLNKDPMINVVAEARDVKEAINAIEAYAPDVITLDIELPGMDGIEFLKTEIPKYRIPVIMVSALSDRVFDALDAGALDFVAKPLMLDKASLEHFIYKDLSEKVRMAAAAGNYRERQTTNLKVNSENCTVSDNCVVVMGASTGGTEAIATVLSQMKPDMPGVVMVIHMPAGFTQIYAKRLNDICAMEVREAKNGDIVRSGLVLLAPGGEAHMHLIKSDKGYMVEIRRGGRVNGHSPSVDVLFDSAATAAGEHAIGVILTGMGNDGAKGLLSMRKSGAHTIGQDEASCVVYGMPKVAHEIGAVEYQDHVNDIAGRIEYILKMRMSGKGF